MTRLPRAFLLTALAAGAAWSAPALAQNDPAAPNFRWRLVDPHPCVRDTVVLAVASYATHCDSFVSATVVSPTHVVYRTQVRDTVACPAVLPRIRPVHLALGLFPAGTHRIEIEWVIEHIETRGDPYTEVRHEAIEFVVSELCSNTGRLPFVEHVQIGPPGSGLRPCVPPGDSIAVLFSGHFPNGCFSLSSIELLPDLTMSPLPGSPRVRLTVEDCACCAIVCTAEPKPWRAMITLPPLRASEHKLGVELVRTSCNAPIERFAAAYPFVVADTCGGRPQPGCVIPGFAPGETSRECNTRIGPGQPGRLTLLLRTTVPVAGMQGELTLHDPALRITRLAPTGAAAGMLLRWSPTERGARFAMFSERGATIPPGPLGGDPHAVLAIAVEVREGQRPAPASLLVVTQLLVSDPEGGDVPWCPTILNDTFRFAAYARICAEPAGRCDFNQDGREDIRDLVMMMRCLRDLMLCADPAGRADCNGDQAFTLDDVLCCAEHILRVDCAGCPPGETRDPGGVKISLGPPAGRAPALDLPFRLEGAGAIGGARLAIRFPSDRYDVSGIEYGGAAASWLQLSEVSGDRVLVGLIDPAGAEGGGGEAIVTLRLALKPGHEPGGEVALESADLTAHDGVRLAADVPPLRQPLGGTPRIALSESRPNPFAATTTFAVTLDRPGAIEVAIFDLSGRRVATLHRGEVPAGVREFSWNGRLADGSRARDGVYFYRAIAGADAQSRKLVLLRQP